jgi:hypothetical protein
VPLFFSFSYIIGITIQNFRFLFFGFLFSIILIGIYLKEKNKHLNNLSMSLLIFFLIIFLFLSFNDRVIQLSTVDYPFEIDEKYFIKDLIEAQNNISKEFIVFTDGFTRTHWWVVAGLESKTVNVVRSSSYKGTDIFQKILDGRTLLETKDLEETESIIKKYGGIVYIHIPQKITRAKFNFDWFFVPNYEKFYNETKNIRVRKIYSSNFSEIIELSVK